MIRIIEDNHSPITDEELTFDLDTISEVLAFLGYEYDLGRVEDRVAAAVAKGVIIELADGRYRLPRPDPKRGLS